MNPSLPPLISPLPVRMGELMTGADDLVVQHDGHQVANVIARQVAEFISAERIELELNQELASLVGPRLRVLQVPVPGLAVERVPSLDRRQDPGAVVVADGIVSLELVGVLDFEPFEIVAGMVARAVFEQAVRPAFVPAGLDQVRVVVLGEDVELQHARAAEPAFEVGGAFQRAAAVGQYGKLGLGRLVRSEGGGAGRIAGPLGVERVDLSLLGAAKAENGLDRRRRKVGLGQVRLQLVVALSGGKAAGDVAAGFRGFDGGVCRLHLLQDRLALRASGGKLVEIGRRLAVLTFDRVRGVSHPDVRRLELARASSSCFCAAAASPLVAENGIWISIWLLP